MSGIAFVIFSLVWATPEQVVVPVPFDEVVTLTTPDQFAHVGQSFISPDGKQVVFQAVPASAEDHASDQYNRMYLAELVHGEDSPRWSLANIRRLSPQASANTSGWFHPTADNRVIFASTIEAPRESDAFGNQKDRNGYQEAYPHEMRIVESRTDGDVPAALRYLEGDEKACQSECSISPDGRHLLYTSMESGDGDIVIKELETGSRLRVLAAPGYEGRSFFSPDGRRICYQSDRNEDDKLQLFVVELAFDDAGAITGVERDIQITHDEHDNGTPFWHSSGRYLVYSSNEADHQNYEVFIVDADAGDPAAGRPARYGTRTARVTDEIGFDGSPAFDAKSNSMIWTSQGADGTNQLCIAEFPEDPEVFFTIPRQKPPLKDHQ